MTITAALILFAVTWFMVFFVTIQIKTDSQAEVSEDVVAGTPKSAPSGEFVKKYALIALLWTVPIWAFEMWFVQSGLLSIDMFDFYGVISD